MNNFKLVDRSAYNEYYRSARNYHYDCSGPTEFRRRFETAELSPYWAGGGTKGTVRGTSTQALLRDIASREEDVRKIRVLDAGCGMGNLSVYLACCGFSVVGIDISETACKKATKLAEKIGVSERARFQATSMERMKEIDTNSIDYIIGHASLHHFIKYPGVPAEFNRILKSGGKGYFADSFGENLLYRLFHDKVKMARLGDVILTGDMIVEYFKDFSVTLTPVDWFAMLDKLWLRILPRKFDRTICQLSAIHYRLDRKIPTNRTSLFLAGSVFTMIQKSD